MRILKYLPYALLLLALLASGCRTLPMDGRLAGGLAAEKIALVDDGSPFDVSPDGNVIALVKSGLQLFHLPTGEMLPVNGRSPLGLAWSPNGYSLAVIYRAEGKNSIAIYDQYGIPLAEAAVEAQLANITWLSESELLAGGFKVTSYKFGSNYRSLLCRWQPGRGKPELTELRDTTLRPSTYQQWQGLLERGPMVAAAGQTGQISYLQPADPPVFTPYYKLVIRDLASGSEIEAASVSFNSDGGRFSADGENMVYGDGRGQTLLYNPWSEELLRTTAAAGRNPAISPDGRSWFADGTLYRGDGEEVLLAPGSGGRFSGDGSRLFIRSGSSLYLVSGMKPATDTIYVPAVAEKVQKLRALRVQGLLTAREYKESLERIMNR